MTASSRKDLLTGGGLGLAYAVWLMATCGNLGFARDEGFYFSASQRYAAWFAQLFSSPQAALTRGAIDAAWSNNHEHPALIKSLFALSWMFLHQKWHFFEQGSLAFRLPGIMMMAVAIATTYLFAARAFGRIEAFAAAAALGLMPSLFYLAHLACFDVPIMAFWVLSIFAFWRAVHARGFGWPIASGVIFGLALETKHNAWILPCVFVAYALGTQILAWASGVPSQSKRMVIALVSTLAIGPAIFFALWPWIWHDTAARLAEYVQFHVHHVYYNIEFLGQNYWGPPSPFWYAPTMIAATVPTITVLCFLLGGMTQLGNDVRQLIGSWQARRNAKQKASREQGVDRASTDLLLFLGFAAAIGPFFLPKTPIFGGTKHWITAYPFMAIFAGRGVAFAARWIKEYASKKPRWVGHAALVALGFAAIAAPLAETIHSHPFGLSVYTPLVGGAPGAAELGLNRQFWGFTNQSAAPYLAAHAPPGASVFIHDTAWQSWSQMTAERRIRPDLRGVMRQEEADYALYQHELHMAEVEYGIWSVYNDTHPVDIVAYDGVPIVTIYERHRAR